MKQEELLVVYEGNEGKGVGKHIVFVSGDEEYRSEEAVPMLAKIMAVHHGFKCTVLFAIDPETGVIDPRRISIASAPKRLIKRLTRSLRRLKHVIHRSQRPVCRRHINNFVSIHKSNSATCTGNHKLNYTHRNLLSP